MSVYARDILSRLPQLLATCTAVFGTILKIDSTEKVCKKLQGTAAGSASWCTNVGNERGEVLMSVLTESEGLEGLRPMASGLIDRYVFLCVYVFLYCNSYCYRSDIARLGVIPHSYLTRIEIAVTSVAFRGVHSCS